MYINKLSFIYLSLKLMDLSQISKDVKSIKDSINNFFYWINPKNWISASWNWLHHNISSGSLDIPLLLFTVIVIWLTMLGAKKPKKICFWIWIIFFVLRGAIFI